MENYNRVDKNSDRIFYFLNDKLHRIDGPAVEYRNGYKEWCQNGKLHRLDGPAIEERYGTNYYYINGKYVKTKEEYDRLVKLLILK